MDIEEQEFEDYKSKYLYLFRKLKSNRQKETVSILDDVDFELIHLDEINVTYIINENLPKIKDGEKVEEAFQEYWEGEKEK